MKTMVLLSPAWCLLLAACGPAERPLSQFQRDVITSSVDSAVRAFAATERALDVEGTVRHLATDFYMYNDGVRADYKSAVASIRSSMPSFEVFETSWTDIEIIVLGPTAAVASFVFHDSITTSSGAVLLLRGPTTLVWEKRGNDWLIVYADADHYPPLR